MIHTNTYVPYYRMYAVTYTWQVDGAPCMGDPALGPCFEHGVTLLMPLSLIITRALGSSLNANFLIQKGEHPSSSM